MNNEETELINNNYNIVQKVAQNSTLSEENGIVLSKISVMMSLKTGEFLDSKKSVENYIPIGFIRKLKRKELNFILISYELYIGTKELIKKQKNSGLVDQIINLTLFKLNADVD